MQKAQKGPNQPFQSPRTSPDSPPAHTKNLKNSFLFLPLFFLNRHYLVTRWLLRVFIPLLIQNTSWSIFKRGDIFWWLRCRWFSGEWLFVCILTIPILSNLLISPHICQSSRNWAPLLGPPYELGIHKPLFCRIL